MYVLGTYTIIIVKTFKKKAAKSVAFLTIQQFKLISLCKKTPKIALLSFLKQSFTICKLLSFKNFESLVFDAFLSKPQKLPVFLLALNNFGKPIPDF